MSLLSRKIKVEIKVREDKPPLVNQQCVVNCFLSVTCAMQNMSVQAIFFDSNTNELNNGSWKGNIIESPTSVFFKCTFNKELKLTLNKQCDSIRPKLFD